MEIVVFPEAATPAGLRTQVVELRNQAWPGGGDGFHDPALSPVSMLLVDEGVVLAALDVLSKELVHAGARFHAGGLSAVVTRTSERGRGHGRHLVSEARRAMPAAGLELGIFTCDRPLRAFYESAGWGLLPDTVLVGGTPSAPFPSDGPGFDKICMAAFFGAAARRAAETFRHARIELYPGAIDKLW